MPSDFLMSDAHAGHTEKHRIPQKKPCSDVQSSSGSVKTAPCQQLMNQSEEYVNVNCIMFLSLQRFEFYKINVSTWDGSR